MAEVEDNFIWIKVRAEPTNTPGLFIHRKVNEDGFDNQWWTITHQSSGLILTEFRIKRKAKEFATRVGKGVDWTLSESQLRKRYNWDKLKAACIKLQNELNEKFPQVDKDEAPF